jgi:hypothetical protein
MGYQSANYVYRQLTLSSWIGLSPIIDQQSNSVLSNLDNKFLENFSMNHQSTSELIRIPRSAWMTHSPLFTIVDPHLELFHGLPIQLLVLFPLIHRRAIHPLFITPFWFSLPSNLCCLLLLAFNSSIVSTHCDLSTLGRPTSLLFPSWTPLPINLCVRLPREMIVMNGERLFAFSCPTKSRSDLLDSGSSFWTIHMSFRRLISSSDV